MPDDYIPILIFALLAAAAPAVGFAWARRASRNAPLPHDSEENDPHAPVLFEQIERRRNSPQIFLVGALFVICDVLIVFLIPWAVRMNELGMYGPIAIGGFLIVLGCGYVWLYRNRALERL